MKKYLVTGAAGFIASQVCKQLLDADNEVLGVDNLNDYYDIRLKEWRLAQLREHKKNHNFRFKKLDVENHSELKELFRAESQFDAVLNLAARAGVRYSMENPHVYLSTNTEGTLNLIDCMKENDCPKFVLASTSSLYAGQPMPFKESLPVNMPLSPYAASKKAAELMAYSYHKLYGLDVSVVRYFTVFGEAGRPDMSIFRFIKWIDEGVPIQLFGDGGQSRDFTYIDDIARGTLAAAKEIGFEIFNLGGGKTPITLNEIIAKIECLIGKKAIIDYKAFHIADIMETWADIDKAKRLLGWFPQTTLDEGLERSVRWYMDNRDWVKEINC